MNPRTLSRISPTATRTFRNCVSDPKRENIRMPVDIRFGSETQFRKVRVAVGEIRDSVLGFIVFDEEMLDAGVLGGGQEDFPIDYTATGGGEVFGDLVNHFFGGLAGVDWRNLAEIFDVDQR